MLDREANLIAIKNLRNETTKAVPSPLGVTDAIFSAGTGRLLLRGSGENVAATGGAGGAGGGGAAAAAAPSSTLTGDRVVLFDVQQRAVVAEVACPGGECFFFLEFFFPFFFLSFEQKTSTFFSPSFLLPLPLSYKTTTTTTQARNTPSGPLTEAASPCSASTPSSLPVSSFFVLFFDGAAALPPFWRSLSFLSFLSPFLSIFSVSFGHAARP